MASCQNCKVMMVALKSQIQELQHQQRLLLEENEKLMTQINEQHSEDDDSAYWKQKYQDQKETNDAISSKIPITTSSNSTVFSEQKTNRPFTPDKSVQPFMTVKTARKENIRDKSARKMSELMKAIVLQKLEEGRRPRRKSDNKREIVLRIVDDRLNRPF